MLKKPTKTKYLLLTQENLGKESLANKGKFWRRMMSYNKHNMTMYRDWKTKTKKQSNINNRFQVKRKEDWRKRLRGYNKSSRNQKY